MALIEINPFEAFNPQTPIRTIFLTSASNLFDLPVEGLSGPTVTLDLELATQLPHYVLSTGVASGQPSMRLLEATDIPNIGMTQVNGLQAAINSLVKSFVSANQTALAITNTADGAYTITPNFGIIANKFAQGNDSRFPSNITGLRKGAGVGSLDTAAVARVDYWDTTNFIASGGSHAKGLVPDPGAVGGATRFLREDATWVTPAGTGTVTSVGLAAPADILTVSGSPVTVAGTLTLTKVNQVANTHFAGPATGPNAAPTFRAMVYADVSPLVGTGASNIAIGNDTRFPASVTGLRKGAGVGSADTAAVAKTDYWNTDVFLASGPANAKGLVPAPGGVAGVTKYLREDASWQPFVPAAGSITNSMLSLMGANTIRANATAGIASPTDVDSKTARSGALLNLESITTFGNADYTALSTDRYVATSAVFTLARTVTLPLANTFNAGQSITISDDFGAINGANTLSIARAGADTIQGSTTPISLSVKYASITLASNGSNKWSITGMRPSVRKVIISSNGTYNTPTGAKALYVECVGGGGGGAGAQAGIGACSVGAGGGAGGYDFKLIAAPSASYVATIGAGGTSGAGANGTGGTGGATDFGGVATGSGGNGGSNTGGSGVAIAFTGLGGAGGGGAVSATESQDGSNSYRLSASIGIAGMGGSGIYGGSKHQPDTQSTGHPGYLYGGGGSGALSTTATAFAGGAGAQGIIFVTEYY